MPRKNDLLVGFTIVLASVAAIVAEGVAFLALDVAHAIIPGVLIPAFLVMFVAGEGAYLEWSQKEQPSASSADQADRIIDGLRRENVEVWSDGRRGRDSVLQMFNEIADDLAQGGIQPVQGRFYHGMNYWGLGKLLSALRIEGLVEPKRTTVSEDGAEYIMETFYLTDGGAGVLRRARAIWDAEID